MKHFFFLLMTSVIIYGLKAKPVYGTAILFQPDSLTAERYFDLGFALRNNYSTDSSATYLKKAATLFEKTGDQRGAVRAYSELGWFLDGQGNFQEAKMQLEKAVALARSIDPNDSILGDTYHYLGKILYKHDDMEQSESALRRALANRIHNHGVHSMKAADTYYSLSVHYLTMHEYDSAIGLVLKSLSILEAIDAPPAAFSDRYNTMGNIQFYKADFARARQFWEKGLSLLDLKSDQDQGIVGMIYSNMGAAAHMEKNYTRAIEYYKRGFNIRRKNLPQGDHRFTNVYVNMAEAYANLGDYAVAIDNFRKALKIMLDSYGELHPGLVQVYQRIGAVYLRMKDLDSASFYFEEALEIDQSIDNVPMHTADLYSMMGDIHKAKGLFDSAEYYFHRSHEIYHATYGDKHPRIATSHMPLAESYMAVQNWEAAEQEVYTALEAISDQPVTGAVPDKSSIQFPNKAIEVLGLWASLITHAYQHGVGTSEDLQKALAITKLAVTFVQEERKLIFNHREQREFSHWYATVYKQGLMLNLMLYHQTKEEHYLKDAFNLLEETRAFALIQSIRSKQDEVAFSLPDSIQSQERQLKVDLSYYEERILRSKANPNGYDTTSILQMESRLFSLNKDFENLQVKLANQYPKYHELRYGSGKVTIDQIQQQLKSDELFIEYFWHDTTLVCFNVSSEVAGVREIPVDSSMILAIHSLNKRFLAPDMAASPSDYADQAHAVYQMLLAPELDSLTFEPKKLIIIPDGMLGQMNFSLLVREETPQQTDWNQLHFLLKDYAFVNGYSASLLFEKRAVRKRPERGMLAFSFGDKSDIRGNHLSMDVVRSSSIDQLPGSAQEIKSISEILDGDYYYGDKASETTFKNVSSEYQILHLAVHGDISDGESDFSRLVLSVEDSIEDGQLHVFELYNMKLNADLAVLSACNSGAGKYQTGEGVMSLGHAFSFAGVNSLLLTRWDLSDEAAPEIMKTFYRELKQGKSKSESLRTAQLEYLESASVFRANPFYWGSFFVMGDDSPVKLPGTSRLYYWMFGFVLMVIVLSYFIRKRQLN